MWRPVFWRAGSSRPTVGKPSRQDPPAASWPSPPLTRGAFPGGSYPPAGRWGHRPLQRGNIRRLSWGSLSSAARTPPQTQKRPPSAVGETADGGPVLWRSEVYLAYSTALVSRSRLTLIWPGYSSSSSIFLAMSRASSTIWSSLTCSGLTMIRTSRPAWMA